jgi:hypothetical protein
MLPQGSRKSAKAPADVLDLERFADDIHAAADQFGPGGVDVVDVQAEVLVAAVLGLTPRSSRTGFRCGIGPASSSRWKSSSAAGLR